MKKKTIINSVILMVATLVIVNTITAYVSYRQVCDKKEPTIKFGVVKKDNLTIYKELLYHVRVVKEERSRTVSLKLFFLK
ncbi:MAG: hypothetical protein U0M66_00400 [Bacilli bacterium]|nr:hypothetical protein [Bacilli bacterium]